MQFKKGGVHCSSGTLSTHAGQHPNAGSRGQKTHPVAALLAASVATLVLAVATAAATVAAAAKQEMPPVSKGTLVAPTGPKTSCFMVGGQASGTSTQMKFGISPATAATIAV